MRKGLLLALLVLVLAPMSIGSAGTDQLRPFGRGSWQDIRKAHAGARRWCISGV